MLKKKRSILNCCYFSRTDLTHEGRPIHICYSPWNCKLVHMPFQKEIELFGLILTSTVLDFYSFGRLPVIRYTAFWIYNLLQQHVPM